MPIAFVRLPATLQQLAIGKTTLYARIAKGTFPPPVKFSERVSAWPQHEVDAVLRALLRSASEEELKELVAHLIRLWNWDVGAEFRISIKKPELQGLRP